jgi:hypothetical protein
LDCNAKSFDLNKVVSFPVKGVSLQSAFFHRPMMPTMRGGPLHY